MKNGEQSAFPVRIPDETTGLTKREYFAAMAMQGIMSNSSTVMRLGSTQEMGQLTATIAVQFADALLAELDKK